MEEVQNHQVNHQGLVRALGDGGSIVRPGAWRGHASFRNCRQEGGLMENKGSELKVRVCNHFLKTFQQD